MVETIVIKARKVALESLSVELTESGDGFNIIIESKERMVLGASERTRARIGLGRQQFSDLCEALAALHPMVQS